ncbi:MAG: RNA 2',3'-cyclic phosphodiesterase [Acidobacteriaceae bacterium]
MRLFVAVEIAPEIRERLTHFVDALRPRVPKLRFVRPEGLHATLKFLGEVAPSRLKSVETELSTLGGASFSIAVEATGFFPNDKRPRIYWAGLRSEPQAALAELASQIDESCARVGFKREQRPYKPHVTLARLGSGNPHGTDAGAMALTPLPSVSRSFGLMKASEFHLYESRLHPTGAIYTKISSYPLLA